MDVLKMLNDVFGKIIIVTNQRGVGRRLMSEEDLREIHNRMLDILENNGAKITKIYFCPDDYEKGISKCRKPNIGMALQAKSDFPDIDFNKSIMVGDSLSDMEFAKNAGMIGVLIDHNNLMRSNSICFESLYEFAKYLRRL